MALILDLADPQELAGYVRGIQLEEERNRFQLAAYLPNKNIDEIEYRITSGSLRDPDAAQFRAWDTEAPIGNRQGLTRIFGELPPLSKKMRLGEEERLRRRMLDTGDGSGLVDAIYDDARALTRAVTGRVELARGEVLETGALAINENGVVQTVTFGRKAGHTVTAAIKWDVPATATPIADTRSWVQTYIDTNGVAPAFGLTSTQVISALMLITEIRQLANTISGAPSIVTLATVQSVFSAFGLPPFLPYDTTVRVNGTSTRVTNAKKVTFMPPAGEPLGNTFFGTTAEALALTEARAIAQDQAPGMIATNHALDDPVATWTKVAAIALPVEPNPDLTLTALVLT
jgi:hypothetical protein